MDRNYSQITFDFAATERPLKPPPPENQLAVPVEEEKVPEIALSDEPVVTFTPVARHSGRGRKPQKSYAAEADLVSVPEDEVLFQKQYYTIGEVSQMFKVNASLLRFWESEFDIIKPRKNRKGDRHFRPVDIKNLQLIYDLLRRRKLTIDGARDFIKNNKKSQERFAMIQSLQKIRGFLLEVKGTL
jgi:DNA-binding transcriptional MerR regulator